MLNRVDVDRRPGEKSCTRGRNHEESHEVLSPASWLKLAALVSGRLRPPTHERLRRVKI
jgi:hypothetical protein